MEKYLQKGGAGFVHAQRVDPKKKKKLLDEPSGKKNSIVSHVIFSISVESIFYSILCRSHGD